MQRVVALGSSVVGDSEAQEHRKALAQLVVYTIIADTNNYHGA